MARTCNSNNDCPQGKRCVGGWCTDSSATGTPIYTCNNDPTHCPVGTTCNQGTCTPNTTPPPVVQTTPPPSVGTTPAPAPPPSGGGGGGGGAPAQANCQQVCMPNDPYQPNMGSVPLGFEGYVSSYSPANVQEGIGPGGTNPANQQYLQGYSNQEAAYQQDWANYYQYMHNGGTTPAPVTTNSLQAQVPQYSVQQGDETTPFTQLLQNPYGF